VKAPWAFRKGRINERHGGYRGRWYYQVIQGDMYVIHEGEYFLLMYIHINPGFLMQPHKTLIDPLRNKNKDNRTTQTSTLLRVTDTARGRKPNSILGHHNSSLEVYQQVRRDGGKGLNEEVFSTVFLSGESQLSPALTTIKPVIPIMGTKQL